MVTRPYLFCQVQVVVFLFAHLSCYYYGASVALASDGIFLLFLVNNGVVKTFFESNEKEIENTQNIQGTNR